MYNVSYNFRSMMRGLGGFSELWGEEKQRSAILAEVKKGMQGEQVGCDSPLCFRLCFISSLIDAAITGDNYAMENLFGVSEDRPVPPIFRTGAGCSNAGVRKVATENI